MHATRYDEPVRAQCSSFVAGPGAASFLPTMLFRTRQHGLVDGRHAAQAVIVELRVRRDACAARRAVWVTDPVWFAGRMVRRATVDAIARWHRATGSLVFVDGTFQYLQWGPGAPNGSRLSTPS